MCSPWRFGNAGPACATPISARFDTSEVAGTYLFFTFLSCLNFLTARVVYVIIEKTNTTDLTWEGIAM